MEYYASFGLGNAKCKKETVTLDTVRQKEQQDPNSTIDARRLVRTIASLAGNSNEGRFLDVGCGSGFFAKEALEHGYDVLALEIAKTDRAIAAQMLGRDPVNTSFEDFKGSAGAFSVVLMSQILEHALDVNLWVEKANVLLKSGGILAIALPNFGSLSRILMREREPYICPPAHLNFFGSQSLCVLLERHGFQVLRTQWISRIPASSIKKRLPNAVKPLFPLAQLTLSVPLKIIDLFKLGIMVNVYAKKIGTVPHRN
jgi:SAM-dependent methyltransferase